MPVPCQKSFTLIEVLISLAVLSLFMIVITDFLQIASRDMPNASKQLQWETAAASAFRLIEHDISVGDIVYDAQMQPLSPIQVINNELLIATRNVQGTPVQHRYMLDDNALYVEQKATKAQNESNRRLLLGNVAEWDIELHEQMDLVSVSIKYTVGETVSRKITW